MAIPKIQDGRSGDTAPSPEPPTTAQVSTAVRALARAVVWERATVARHTDGSVWTEVSLIGLAYPYADRLWRELLAGMTAVRPEEWRAGPLACREATGLLLGGSVRIVTTDPVRTVSA